MWVYAIATQWTFAPNHDPGRYDVGQRFFWAQADAILNGRLDVARSDLVGECFYFDDRCYGYFGVIPSLLRIPLLVVLGPANRGLAAPFLAIAVAIAVYFAVDLTARVLAERSNSLGHTGGPRAAAFMLLAATMLGPASVLVLLAQPYPYHEAIAWGAAGTCAAANYVWRWSRTPTDRLLIYATVAAIVAAGSRPTAIAVSSVAAIGLALHHRQQHTLDQSVIWRLAVFALLPVALTLGVFQLKFSTPVPSYEIYEQFRENLYVMNDGSLAGPRFTPTSLFAYLRPDTVTFGSARPWFGFRFPFTEPTTYLPPLAKNSMYEENTASITTTMPIAVIISSISAVWVFSRRSHRIESTLLLALVTVPLIVSINYALTSRYLADFYPFVAVGVAFSPWALGQFSRLDRAVWRGLATVAFASTAISVAMLWALVTQY